MHRAKWLCCPLASPALTHAPQAHAELQCDYADKQAELERLERLVDSTMSVRLARPLPATPRRRADASFRAQRWRGVGSSVASAPTTPASSRCASPAFGMAPSTPLSLPAVLPTARLPPSGKTAVFGALPARAGLGDMSNLWRR